ncbi:preprotein translocase subunit SecE [Lapillicoccus sp.]|uniref:preprotein translocase subunit SecE n=1 Tax=Lapillicoccus sp. TaxID=1909287 RepID=UPI0032646FA1
MTETSAGSRDSGRATRKRPQEGNVVSRAWRSLALFVSQILDELRKVVRPTGRELVNYTGVVIVFVMVIMGIVAALDLVFHRLVLLILAG